MHEKWSNAGSGFIGPVEYQGKKVWEFKCSYMPHQFFALPDRSAPSAPEEVAAWTQGQLSQRIQKTQWKRQ